MNIADLIEHPINPRVIRDSRFKDLVKSILELPNGLRYNKIKYNPTTNEVIAGNMRSRALRFIHNCDDLEDIIPENPTSTMTREEIKDYFSEFKETGELPDEWVEPVTELTEREMLEFMIKDNLQFGETDWDILKEEWSDKVDLVGLGFEDAAWLENEVDLDDFFSGEHEVGGPAKETFSVVFTFRSEEEYTKVQAWVGEQKSPESALLELI